MTSIKIVSTDKGKRAFRWDARLVRYFPMKLAEAELLLSTGKAQQVNY